MVTFLRQLPRLTQEHVSRLILLPLASTAGACAVRGMLDPWLEDRAPFLLLVLAVVVSAWYGGVRAGVSATALAAAAGTYLFVLPRHAFGLTTAADWLGLFTFLGVGGLISLMGGRARRALDESRRSERRLHSAIDAFPGPFALLDPERRLRHFNVDVAALASSAGAELVGRRCDEVFRPEVAAALAPAAERAVTSGERATATVVPCEGPLRGRRLDATYVPIVGNGGVAPAVEHLLLFLVDVTDRERAGEALRQNEARFRQLAEAMPQIVWTADASGAVDYYNRRWQELSGLSPSSGLGQGWELVVHPDDEQRTTAAWRRSIESGTAYEVVHRLRTAAGDYRWYLSRALPVTDEQGRVVKWQGTATDIDDRVRAEEALREADRRKDEFLSMLAHELRNPLAPIRLALELLDADDPERRRRAREVVARQTEQLTRTVDDLLEVSRITRGKIRLELQEVDVAAVVSRAVDSVRHLTDAREQQLELHLPDDPVRLRADPVRLAQVLSNLLHNATKYTPRGGRIDVTAVRAGRQVVLRVRDTGVGIPRALLDRVFDLFVQADRSLDRSEGGLGIGLTLARRLVEMHGGTIHASSEGPNRGSEFVVRLPALVDAPAGPTPVAALPGEGEAHDNGGARRVLVVDDNADAADLLCDILRGLGHEVRVARDGLAALAEVASFHPEVLLLDIGLPGLDGYEVAARVRHADREQPLLVAVTGYGQASDRRRSLEAGFDHHLVKPVDPSRLQAILAQSH